MVTGNSWEGGCALGCRRSEYRWIWWIIFIFYECSNWSNFRTGEQLIVIVMLGMEMPALLMHAFPFSQNMLFYRNIIFHVFKSALPLQLRQPLFLATWLYFILFLPSPVLFPFHLYKYRSKTTKILLQYYQYTSKVLPIRSY